MDQMDSKITWEITCFDHNLLYPDCFIVWKIVAYSVWVKLGLYSEGMPKINSFVEFDSFLEQVKFSLSL